MNSSKRLAVALHPLDTEILSDYVLDARTSDSLHTLIYCSALAAARVTGAKIHTRRDIRRTRRQPNTPQWEIQLTKKIEALRGDIRQLTDYLRRPKCARVERSAQLIISRVKLYSQQDPSNSTSVQCLDTQGA
ncbi:hypothetical protein HHI36_001213 [Cryptolaemus montrouzieri]|uniref:Uncharacterized protein n=1 Tax=Cryptolaemus montrouzieri TaxID=559131 RepID=A0ABD2P7J6_9CUCU